jgi:hypothetical protein
VGRDQPQIDLPMSPTADLGSLLASKPRRQGERQAPSATLYMRRLKAFAGETLRCTTKISLKTAIKNNNNDDSEKITSSGA